MLYIPSEQLHAVTIYVIFEKQGPCPRHDTRAFEGRRRIKGGQVCEGGLTPLSPADGREAKRPFSHVRT